MSGNPPTNNATFTLQEILDCCAGRLLTPAHENMLGTSATGVCTDSRSITKNAIFVALSGEKFDGHTFLPQVANAGAAVAIVEKDILQISYSNENFTETIGEMAIVRVENTLKALGQLARHHRERFTLPVIGITGSYGKTTTRAFVAAALKASVKVLSTQENYNNEIGVPQTLLQLDKTHQAAVIEMGMRGEGQIEYLAKIASPTVGIITNIGPQHIELLGSMENIAAAKAELVQNLPADGAAILPADDAFFDFLAAQSTARHIISFGRGKNSDFRAIKSTFDEQGNSIAYIHTPHHDIATVHLTLPGMHNAINAAAALAVADFCNVDVLKAAAALKNMHIPGARMRVRQHNAITIIDDCYNAGPFSVRASLEVLRDFPRAGRRVAVLGAMLELGDHSAEEHRIAGAKAGEIVSLVIGVGTDTKVLLQAAQNARCQEVLWFDNSTDAAQHIHSYILPGDIILVKGSRGIALEKVVEALCGHNQ